MCCFGRGHLACVLLRSHHCMLLRWLTAHEVVKYYVHLHRASMSAAHCSCRPPNKCSQRNSQGKSDSCRLTVPSLAGGCDRPRRLGWLQYDDKEVRIPPRRKPRPHKPPDAMSQVQVRCKLRNPRVSFYYNYYYLPVQVVRSRSSAISTQGPGRLTFSLFCLRVRARGSWSRTRLCRCHLAGFDL
jgi:hypothetical protein